MSSGLRVVARYQMAYVFPSDKALNKYLNEHPNADRTKHTVEEMDTHDHPNENKTPPEGGGHQAPHEEPKQSWKDRLKGLGEKVHAFMKSAPEKVQQFVTDDAYRRDVLTKASEAVANAPEKMVENAVAAIKEEAHEFKLAGAGIKAVLKGGKMDAHQKKAFKTVAIDLAVTVSVAALTAGLASGMSGLASHTAKAFTTALAKKIALKSVKHSLGMIPMIEELGHGAHGIAHLFQHAMSHVAADKKPDEQAKPLSPEEIMALIVSASVAKELPNLTEDDLYAALQSLEGPEHDDTRDALAIQEES